MKFFTRPVIDLQSCDVILGDFAMFVTQQQTCLNTQNRSAAQMIGREWLLFIRLQIRAAICTVLTGNTSVACKVNKLV